MGVGKEHKGEVTEQQFKESIMKEYEDVKIQKIGLFDSEQCNKCFYFENRLLAQLLINSMRTPILAASFHLVGEKGFCNGKEPLVRSKHIAGIHILLQFLTQEIRNRNFPLTFPCFWSGNDILPVKTLIGFIDINLFCNKVDISSSKSQKLPFTHV